MGSSAPLSSNSCATCGTKLKGNFCWHCGERRLNPDRDYSLHKFIEQTVDGFTHFDSKFLRSFKALLLKPGFLTSEFIHGRRSRYMKPVQIFIIASVLFYFAFPKVPTFYASIAQLQTGGKFDFDVSKAIEDKAAADGTSVAVAIKSIETEAAHSSKTYLFLIIPFWGALFYLLFWRSNRFFVPHIIFSMHNVAFFILLFMFYYAATFLIGLKKVGDNELVPMAVIYLIYLFAAIRKAYQRNLFWSFSKTVASFAGLLALFIIYREGITLFALRH